MHNRHFTRPSELTEIVERKQSHVEICLNGPIDYENKTNGFDHYFFEHTATPEVNFSEIDLSTTFLGRKISYPLMISSMTGGYSGAMFVNQMLAEICQHLNIPLGVGSMRQALEDKSYQQSFEIVRKVAQNVQIFANIGAPEVAQGLSRDQLKFLTNLIKADGLIIHINPAQELFQPEGNTNFKGFLSQLKALIDAVQIPVIAKEVGAGISGKVAARLIDAGVTAIDVAGAGGTSWQKVEKVRYERKYGIDKRFSATAMNELLNWGIPTAECLVQITKLKASEPEKYNNIELISSGGISNGVEIAKSLALGAQIAASARPILKQLLAREDSSQDNLERTIMTWMNDLRATMFLAGVSSIAQLRQTKLICRQRQDFFQSAHEL
ncbi:isopentenyl-diphosphate delta-isomerase, type 2 [Chloroherpeton thalassium ATCC 35110]|uniref:Isopentenyl-diphosphate delta-isomerase n=1 Tax=Chloroherpeton thalassium (strain ATCC 35110 / GB-78) TaxID=517418 RepID=B3QU76_CHLT3|nr:type 2 isopentenyl-diphosphate Delta-isomerase [Chloroherpeton thalassium]ACF12874.1 isopentenyl-diphosphate delta-isomerase, type 2 [Chloroherpeton thalassium ATCC 35110]